jgi:hypothetical protein
MKADSLQTLTQVHSALTKKAEEEQKNMTNPNQKAHYFPSKQILPILKVMKNKYVYQ